MENRISRMGIIWLFSVLTITVLALGVWDGYGDGEENFVFFCALVAILGSATVLAINFSHSAVRKSLREEIQEYERTIDSLVDNSHLPMQFGDNEDGSIFFEQGSLRATFQQHPDGGIGLQVACSQGDFTYTLRGQPQESSDESSLSS